jgi:ubiquinone/menaquinone biosynthesis C-methylase UbiE
METMQNRFFDLDTRVPLAADRTPTLDRARGYDLTARVSLRFPMERVTTLLSPLCRPDATVVEVGSATGLLSIMLAAACRGAHVIGIEENAQLLGVAEENSALATIARTPARVEFRHGRLSRIPLNDGSADVVFAFLSLYRSTEPVRMLQECARVCKPDGLIFLYEMARDADEGMISFILQYVNTGQAEFMESLKASYSTSEVADLLLEAGLTDWHITREQLNVRITNRLFPAQNGAAVKKE